MIGTLDITIGIVKPYKNNDGGGNIGEYLPIAFLELRLIGKGPQNTNPDRIKILEIGDFVEGMKDEKTLWKSARYNGGDPTDRNNYTPMVEVDLEDYAEPLPVPIPDPENPPIPPDPITPDWLNIDFLPPDFKTT